MPDIPIRLVAINARIPKGESCDGCEFISFVPYDSAGVASTREACGEPYLAMYGCVRTDGARLPACRERDGYAVYPPGTPAPLTQLPQLLLDLEDLARSAESFLESSNSLWLANNPTEAERLGEVPMDLEEAQEMHSGRFGGVRRAVYSAMKSAARMQATMEAARKRDTWSSALQFWTGYRLIGHPNGTRPTTWLGPGDEDVIVEESEE